MSRGIQSHNNLLDWSNFLVGTLNEWVLVNKATCYQAVNFAWIIIGCDNFGSPQDLR
jgi:hypothetical protein